MKSISRIAASPFRFVKRILKKSKRILKGALKSNKFTYAVCKKVKDRIRQAAAVPEIRDVGRIVKIMCPEDEYKRQQDTIFDKKIVFSILVPLYNTPERFLREMIESVQYQTYEHWELCLADGSDDRHGNVEKICLEYADKDKRIKYKKLDENKGISSNTNACIDMASGDYIALFDHDDFLHPSALYENMKAICETGADYLYTDEAIFNGTNLFDIIIRHCKPDYAIDNLRAVNYICHFSVFSSELLKKAGRFRSAYDGSQDHDIILRLTENAHKIYHIRKILYYWRSHPDSVAGDISGKSYAIDSAKRAVENHLERTGLKAEVESSRAFPTIFRFKYELNAAPKVSIIISGSNRNRGLKRCIRSIVKKTTYSNYEIIAAVHNGYKKDCFDYIKESEKKTAVNIVTYEGTFNYARINNLCAANVEGEFIILLDHNTKIISPDWIQELLMYAQREDVAAVGAKIYYPDNTIRHAGIVVGLGTDGIAGTVHHRADRDDFGYMNRLFYSQDVSAVSSICMMIRTSVYHELGGLDEAFIAAFHDVDLCLRAREKGYLNIFTPYCELYYYDTRSCAGDNTSLKYKKELELFRRKWKKVVENGDPYYNPNASLDRSDYTIEA